MLADTEDVQPIRIVAADRIGVSSRQAPYDPNAARAPRSASSTQHATLIAPLITSTLASAGLPVDLGLVEALGRSYGDKCLVAHWFRSSADAREKVDAWREEYNAFRPHGSIGDMPPREFVRRVAG